MTAPPASSSRPATESDPWAFEFVERHRLGWLCGWSFGFGLVAVVEQIYGLSVSVESGFFSGLFFTWAIHEWWNRYEQRQNPAKTSDLLTRYLTNWSIGE